MTDSRSESPAGPGDEAPSSSSPGFLPTSSDLVAGDGDQIEGRGAKSAPLTPLEEQLERRVRSGKGKKGGPRPGKWNGPDIPRGGRQKGGPPRQKTSPAVKKLRGEIALAQHLGGKPLAEIAREFGVGGVTLRKDVNDAIRGQLFQEARNFIQGTLVPKALQVIDAALDAGDTETARWVADKTAFHAESRPYAGAAGSAGTESFESWRLELVRKVRSSGPAQDQPATAPPEGAQGASISPHSVIDAQVISKESV